MALAKDNTPAKESLAPYKSRPFHLVIRDKLLREQVSVVLALLGFEFVTKHPVTGSYMDNVRRIAKLLAMEDGVFLINPPLMIQRQGGKVKIRKEFSDFFSDLSLLLSKGRRNAMKSISKCVPIFPDMQLTQRREQLILSLAEYGVCGAFILKPLDSLEKLSPSLYKIRMKEQVLERLEELGSYLTDYLPHMDGALEELVQKKEEMELTKRKEEAEALMREGQKAKSKRDFNKAIECFQKAIDLLPEDPSGYMESGRVFVHVKRYSKALLRFNQAGEISSTIPEPNKEIGNVRVLQARDRILRGESPTSPAVMELLQQAYEHYEIALKKAAAIKSLHPDDKRQRDVDAVSRIAGEMVKLNMKQLLGAKHTMALRFGNLAREAFSKVGQEGQPPTPSQHLFLGIAAMDDASFKEAEDHLLEAAKDPDCFKDACNELTHMGILVRKHAGPKEAIDIYRKLLELNPPNGAAVNFNLAVAYSLEKHNLESTGAIIQALYEDPSLAENDMFYNNQQLNMILETAHDVFSRVVDYKGRPMQLVLKAVELQERLENLILDGMERKALLLVKHVLEVMPDFFLREHVAASRIILKFIREKSQLCMQSKKAGLREFGGHLEGLHNAIRARKFSKRLIAYTSFKIQALRLLRDDLPENEPLAANLYARAAVCHPEYVEAPEFHANERLNALGKVIFEKMESVDFDRME